MCDGHDNDVGPTMRVVSLSRTAPNDRRGGGEELMHTLEVTDKGLILTPLRVHAPLQGAFDVSQKQRWCGGGGKLHAMEVTDYWWIPLLLLSCWRGWKNLPSNDQCHGHFQTYA